MTHYAFRLSCSLIISAVLSGCGGSGSNSETNNTPTLPSDVSPPEITFTPNTIALLSTESAVVELSFTDDQTTQLSPVIVCENGGVFDASANTYTAPETSSVLVTNCTASVSDNAGNESHATLSITVNPQVADTTAPTISFSPSTLNMASGTSAQVQLSFSDDTDTTLTPQVECVDGAINDNVYTAPNTRLTRELSCTATVYDAAQNQSTSILTINVAGSAVADLSIDIFNLPNYQNQPVPDYISQDNTKDNPITDLGATLGRVLFYDKNLSTNNTISCASCHQQAHAFSDLAPLSQGVNDVTARHSMRLVNARFAEETRFRWDENAESLEQQTTMPIRDFAEMGFSGNNGAPSFGDLLSKLSAIDYYQDLFALTFGDSTITEERMQRAMAQFIRSIQSFDTKYDIGRGLVASHDEDFPNFTASENAGKRLFTQPFEFETDVIQDQGQVPVEGTGQMFEVSRRISGGINCATCHRPPEFDIDPASLNNGFIRVGAPAGENPRGQFDLSVTRSPSLRELMKPNGELNGGMFHTGLSSNLTGIPAHYDFRRLVPENDNLDPRLAPNGLPQFLDLTNEEAGQLFDFLRTLSGSNVYTDAKWSDPFE